MAPWGAAVPLVPELRFGAAGLGRRRISRPPDASVSWGGGVWERLRCGCRWHRECCGWCAAMRTAAWLRVARAVPCWSAAQGLRALGCFVDAGWQDSRAVHDSRGPCSEKGPFLARYSRGVSSDGGLRGISDAWRADPAKASSFRMHGARILPRTGDFPVRGRFRDAWSAKLATDCRPGTHRGGILPRQDPRERTVREYCHCQSGQERIRAQSRHRRTPGERISRAFCHRRAPGNVSRHNLATTGCPRRMPRAPMRHGSRLAHGRGSERPPLSTPPDILTPLNCGCCRRFGRWRWHNPLIVALLPSGS